MPVYTANGAFSRYSLANLWQHQFSQEIQAVGTVGIVDYVAGLFYFNEHVSDNAATPNSNIWNADGTGYTINTAALQNPFASIDLDGSLRTRFDAADPGAYENQTWDFLFADGFEH